MAAAALGCAVGAGTAAGAALLLFTGRGFLATAGFLIGVTLAAVAAGVWVGVPDPRALLRRPEPTRARWIWTILAFSTAGVFTALWDRLAALREHPFGGALAVLLVLAEPAYAAATLVVALQWRDAADPRSPDNRTAVIMILGAAVGVVVATTTLIPRFDPPGIYLGAATLLAIFGAIEATRAHASGPREPSSMHDRAVLITGVGDRGQVGFALARRFLAAGARVLITNRSGDLQPLAAALTADGDVAAINADLANADDVARLLDAARERFGRLDALIHAAGGLGVINPIAETTPEDFRAELERNATTTYLLLHAALPLLRASRGTIVTFASPAGERAVAKLGAYSAAKAGVIALTRAVALEEKENGVRANAIAPGMIDTEQNRATAPADAKFVTREEIAEVALFLASAASAGLSGETITVMGEALA
jgi:NAD(P)-dependent dehydrogenase (short-subunit alcohol dehydrogenase family)